MYFVIRDGANTRKNAAPAANAAGTNGNHENGGTALF